MSKLPKGFGLRTTSSQGAPPPKVPLPSAPPASATGQKDKETEKEIQRKRKLHHQTLQESKKKKSQDQPINLASMEFGQLAEVYVDPEQVEGWKKRSEQQALEAIRRAAAEIFFHTHYDASDFEKNRARLNALEEENQKLKAEAKGAAQELSQLHAYKESAERSISILKVEENRLRTELNSMGQSLTATSERVFSLENELASLNHHLQAAKDASFEEGFKSYVTGFLAVEPDFNWAKFGEETVKWMADFKVEAAQAIADKKAAIEQERAEAVNIQISPARQDVENDQPKEVPPLTSDEPAAEDAP